MKLFIANPTQQYHDFHYQLPESRGLRSQVIPPGNQIQIAGIELTPDTIDSIINHHKLYGLIREDERRVTGYIGLIYQIDKPVRIEALQQRVVDNRKELIMRGHATRQAAAVQATNNINQQIFEQQMPDTMKNFEVTVEEMNRDPRDTTDEINQGIKVIDDAELELSGASVNTKAKPATPRRVSLRKRP